MNYHFEISSAIAFYIGDIIEAMNYIILHFYHFSLYPTRKNTSLIDFSQYYIRLIIAAPTTSFHAFSYHLFYFYMLTTIPMGTSSLYIDNYASATTAAS